MKDTGPSPVRETRRLLTGWNWSQMTKSVGIRAEQADGAKRLQKERKRHGKHTIDRFNRGGSARVPSGRTLKVPVKSRYLMD